MYLAFCRSIIWIELQLQGLLNALTLHNKCTAFIFVVYVQYQGELSLLIRHALLQYLPGFVVADDDCFLC